MLFLAKLISVLKNKLFIMKIVFNIKNIILFKAIMQEIIFSRTRDNDNYNYFQLKDNKFFKYQLNQNQQSN